MEHKYLSGKLELPFVCPLGLLEDLVTLSLDFMLVFVSVRFQDMALFSYFGTRG